MLFLLKFFVGGVLVFCLYLLGSGVYQAIVHSRHVLGANKATGKVVQYLVVDEDRYRQTVEYKGADGKTRKAMALNTSDKPTPNKRVDVYENNGQVLVGSLWEIYSFSLMAVSMGGLFSFLIIWLIYKTIQGSNRRKQARERGLPVEAIIRAVEKVADQKPYQWSIEAKWKNPINGKEITFLSDLFEQNDVSRIVPGKRIRVMVDMSDPERAYWVDLSSVGINYGRT